MRCKNNLISTMFLMILFFTMSLFAKDKEVAVLAEFDGGKITKEDIVRIVQILFIEMELLGKVNIDDIQKGKLDY